MTDAKPQGSASPANSKRGVYVRIVFGTLLQVAIMSLAILFATKPSFTAESSALPQEQSSSKLTWSKLSDQKPNVIVFSPDFERDRLALFGTSNKDPEHGLWRSTDGGETWVKSSEGIPETKEIDVYDIEFSPNFTQDQTVFASVNKQKITMKEAPGALFRSTDAGQTWQEVVMSGFPSMGIRPMQDLVSFAISPDFAQDGTLFAVVGGQGVYRSTDQGSTWKAVLAENANEVSIAPGTSSDRLVAVASANSGMLLSTDGGESWSPSSQGLEGIRGFKRVLFSADFPQDKTILAMTPTDGIFISRDAGASWENVGRTPENTQMLLLAATPHFATDGTLAYALRDATIFLSRDLGQTWEHTNSASILGGQIQALALSPDYTISQILYSVSVFNGFYRYLPVEAGSGAAVTATAVSVKATLTAEAVPTSLAQQEQKRSEAVAETGCITYTIAPAMTVGILLRLGMRRRAMRERDEE